MLLLAAPGAGVHSRFRPPSSKTVVEAILDGELQLFQPQQLHGIGGAKFQLSTDRVVEPLMDYAEPVSKCVHCLVPIDMTSIGPAAVQNTGACKLHRANPMRSDIAAVR